MTFNDQTTEREPQAELFQRRKISGHDFIYYQALMTLEETNYCDFEVQFEMLHNCIHYLVGGQNTFSMSTLEYSAFDPFFMVHHASIDRIWTIWQELQKLRHKPFNSARCAQRILSKPLEPFSYHSVNPNELTRANSRPEQIFDSEKFHYHFDKLDLNGHSVSELNAIINGMRSSDRVYAAFVLSGISTSAVVNVELEGSDGQSIFVGKYYVLGGASEMPWAYERLYHFDATDAAHTLGLGPYSNFNFHMTYTKYDGTPLTDVSLPDPVILYRPAHADYDVVVVPIGTNKQPPAKVT